ncbi:MAG: hypothetical protein N2C14_19730, partial [Planctomycetales bacterium]
MKNFKFFRLDLRNETWGVVAKRTAWPRWGTPREEDWSKVRGMLKQIAHALTSLLLLALGVSTACWLHYNRSRLESQWMCYRVGAAENYTDAERRLARMEDSPNRDEQLRDLVEKWGAGNPRFDYYLARYLNDPACGDDLREAFAMQLTWRPELLDRWIHFWRWRSKIPPSRRLSSLASHLETMARADAGLSLSWRETLDVQVLFAVTGQRRLAERLRP